jgi:hypothetical protein
METLIIITVIIAAVIAYRRGGKAQQPRLRGYGIVVDGHEVKSHGKVLGDLAGSLAEVADPTSRHTATRVITVVGAFTKKTNTYLTIAFSNGGIHQVKIDGAAVYRQATAWAAKYNAMANTESVSRTDLIPQDSHRHGWQQGPHPVENVRHLGIAAGSSCPA